MQVAYRALILSVALVGIFSAEYGPIHSVDDLITQLNYIFDLYLHQYSVEMRGSFYIYDFDKQFGYYATVTTDRQAGDHVIKSRSNYTSAMRLIKEVAYHTRDTLLEDVETHRELILSTIPKVEAVSSDLTQILRRRNCPEDSIQSFLLAMYETIRTNIYSVYHKANQRFIGPVLYLGERSSIPDYLIRNFEINVNLCFYAENSKGLKCILRSEDLFLSSSLNMFMESSHQVEQYVSGLNYRIAHALVSDIEHELIHAFQSVFKYDCFSASTESV